MTLSFVMIYLVYNTFLTFLLILSSPYFLIRSVFKKPLRKALIQRMGFLGIQPLGDSIWIHAASVGEVFCSIPLVRRIKKEYPNRKIVLTTMTSTGREAARTQLPELDHILFFPIDHPFILWRVLKKIQPALLLIAETELWPNLLRSCGKRGIPIILFNGRISEKSLRGYLFFRFLFKECLKNVSLFLMQTNEDQERIIQIGAPPDKTRVVGNLKFDQVSPSVTQEATTRVAHSLGLQGGETVFIAGSTHSGEEELLMSLSKELRQFAPDLIFIVAPRHLNRLEEVEQVLQRESVSWIRKTAIRVGQDWLNEKRRPDVILLDTMGELMNLYRLATVVFIGGSLVPVGGHNPLEPLFFKKCLLFGPFMFHFSEIARRLVEEGGAIQVNGIEDLSSHLRRLLKNERARKEMGERGYQFLRKHQGATERMFEEIRRFLT
ncbi:MAG: 3-deoxy-D-manno-octulosonic acid transferase [Thermodesulfobacteriota bacterium]